MTNVKTTTASEMSVQVLMAGPDTLCFPCDLPLSEAMRDRSNEEKATAQTVEDERRVHCHEWLSAHVCPQVAKGGYAFLIEPRTTWSNCWVSASRIDRVCTLRCALACCTPILQGYKGLAGQRWHWIRERLYADQPSTVDMRQVSAWSRRSCAASFVQGRPRAYAPSKAIVRRAMPSGKDTSRHASTTRP
jgi:hypothetical protein